jgi:hypothetical protein
VNGKECRFISHQIFVKIVRRRLAIGSADRFENISVFFFARPTGTVHARARTPGQENQL